MGSVKFKFWEMRRRWRGGWGRGGFVWVLLMMVVFVVVVAVVVV